MTFKEQMQEKAREKYPVLGDAPEGNPQWFIANARNSYTDGADAALSSDLVKGLVEALENIMDDPQFDNFCLKCKRMGKAALTNYKQEVK